ncbi:hypothetical protein [Kitasatospora griseola]|uniref:hypothetical protein n=1 Tax=Kitasatospora griseola TaxID=2064 RepID=UPI003445A7FE
MTEPKLAKKPAFTRKDDPEQRSAAEQALVAQHSPFNGNHRYVRANGEDVTGRKYERRPEEQPLPARTTPLRLYPPVPYQGGRFDGQAAAA